MGSTKTELIRMLKKIPYLTIPLPLLQPPANPPYHLSPLSSLHLSAPDHNCLAGSLMFIFQKMKLFCCTPSQLGVLFMVKRPGASSH
ncbi:hypothetical protein AAG906_022517 [Vitis piasezkii]